MMTDIVQRYNTLLEESYDDFLERVAVIVAYIFLYESRYEITHEWDPPYDYSGQVVKTKEPFSFEDYKTIKDLWSAYTGDSHPIFVSGCGMGHSTYYELFDEIAMDYVFELLDVVAQEIVFIKDMDVLALLGFKSDGEIPDVSDIVSELHEYFSDWDSTTKMASDLLHDIGHCNLKELYERGEDKAKEQRASEIKKNKEDAERNIVNRRKCEEVKVKLMTLYEETFHEPFRKVDKIDAERYLTFKIFFKDNFTAEELRLLLIYASYPPLFSNSVSSKLMLLYADSLSSFYQQTNHFN